MKWFVVVGLAEIDLLIQQLCRQWFSLGAFQLVDILVEYLLSLNQRDGELCRRKHCHILD